MNSPRSVYSMATSQIMNKEASQAVESLFESQSITDIKEVETKTRAEIDAKKKQLRSLVGDSYRDVISSADTILAMSRSCQTVVSNIQSLQEGLVELSKKAASTTDVKREDLRMQKFKQLHGVGSRVKYLVDTPEIIWGFMDTHAYLEAAKRYLQAEEVHKLLTENVPQELRSRFPLVRSLWPNIQKFRAQLLTRLQSRLNQHEHLSVRDSGLALSASAYLQNLSSEQALDTFLEGRLAAMRRVLNSEPQALPSAISAVTPRLKEAIQLIQMAIWQAGRLFLNQHGEENAALISMLPFEDGLTASLSFSPILAEQSKSEVSETPAWQLRTSKLKEGLVPLHGDKTAARVKDFLSRCAEVIREFGEKALSGGMSQAEDVVASEIELRQCINAWQYLETHSERILTPKTAEIPKTPPRTPRPAATPRSPKTPFTPGSPFSRQFSMPKTEVELPKTWQATCEWVLKDAYSLWDQLLDPIFRQIEKDLVESSFKSLESRLHESIQECLDLAQHMPQESSEGLVTSIWAKSAVSPESRKRARPEPVNAHQLESEGSWRKKLAILQKDYNESLHGILHATGLLITAQEDVGREKKTRRMYSGKGLTASTSSQQVQPDPRAAQLQQHLHSIAEKFADSLKGQLEASLPSSAPADRLSNVEALILIGQLGLLFGSTHSALGLVWSAPDSWASLAGSNPSLGASGVLKLSRQREPQKSSFPAIQDAFRKIAHRAQEGWAQWLSTSLGDQLKAALRSDPQVTAKQALTTWQETVVRQEEEGERESEETKFQLPALPSSYVMMLLIAASRELQRAGLPSSGSKALTYLRLHLSQKIVSVYRDLLENLQDERPVGESGGLQLLFDVRLLKDIFVGNVRPSRAQPTKVATTSEEQQKLLEAGSEFEMLEESLQEKVDPIDWAIYAMYLWKGEAMYFQRIKILCGALLQGNTVHAEVPNKSASLTEANLMNLGQTPSRFAYLPVSIPTAPMSQEPALPSLVKLIGIEEEGLDSSYSFAKLDSLGLKEHAQASSSSAASSPSAMTGTGATQRLGVLGSLLGDRAAEVTAMAQQSFHDISLPSAFSTLSGPTSGAGGLFSSFRGLRG